jgi:hypothetical protein
MASLPATQATQATHLRLKMAMIYISFPNINNDFLTFATSAGDKCVLDGSIGDYLLASNRAALDDTSTAPGQRGTTCAPPGAGPSRTLDFRAGP